ncbi:MAG: helix-turn-helix transcriptional regulator [Pseudomonadota bacterium]
MDYQEHPVPDNLQRHIACVWRLIDDNPRAGINTIYPDGRCELIVQLGGRSRLWDAIDGWHEQAPTLFAAQRVTAVQFEPVGVLDDVGIRLQPAASTLVTRDLASLRDRVVDLASIDAEASAALAPAAREFAAGGMAPLWELFSRLCSRRAIDVKVENAAAQLDSDGGQTKIEAIAKAASLSVRSLQTRFLANVGLTPKEFAGIQRLQSTLRALDGQTPLADLATDSGFSDQAHATRAIKRVTGLTLSRLRDELRRNRDGNAAIEIAAAFVRGYA